MMCWRRLITAIIGVLLLAGFARADMAPIGHGSPQQPIAVEDSTEVQSVNLTGLHDQSILRDFILSGAKLQLETITDNEPPARTAHSLELSGGPDSVSFCLYALMSLGLCSSPHWVKRLHLSHLPDWYHDGAPFQIGHSFAATPESLCRLQVCCYLPPDYTAEEFYLRVRLRSIVSCWRKSQYTPEGLVSRGPPLFS